MTNFEKYKTAEERAGAFRKYHDEHHHECRYATGNESPIDRCVLCMMEWLDLKAEEEKPLPCPFCGGHAKAAMHGIIAGMAKYRVSCTECDCNYGSPICESMDAAISAHNRVAKAVMDAKAREANDEDAK